MILRPFAALLLALALTAPVFAADHDKSDAKPAAEAKAAPAPQEKSVVTEHSVSINGRSYAYKATAGTLIIRNEKGEPDASMFYVAYTVGDDKDAGKRPVTFLYNGGPGSSSIWLHMGSFAPERIETASPDATPPAPYHLVPNADSLLDKTDLVFVDAIGTGFSHGFPNAKDKKDKDANPDKRFWGTDEDIDAFGRFVQRYITKYNR
ncbi:MAG: peptidase S10, partial [Xanthomonadaceae bacterium]|nr:peptidase S10 [Xanthomonadaceae bacterium]